MTEATPGAQKSLAFTFVINRHTCPVGFAGIAIGLTIATANWNVLVRTNLRHFCACSRTVNNVALTSGIFAKKIVLTCKASDRPASLSFPTRFAKFSNFGIATRTLSTARKKGN